MPRYYFHLTHNGRIDLDAVGVDLSDIGAAEIEAKMAIAEAVRDAALRRVSLQGETYEVVDAAGKSCLTLSFEMRVRTPLGDERRP